MKNTLATILLIAVIGTSCRSTLPTIFGKQTPREKYEEKLDDKDLDKTPEGRQWLAASKQALENPLSIKLPYKHTGFFHADKPRALALKFNAKQGERLIFSINKKASNNFVLLSDIFKHEAGDPDLVFSAGDGATQYVFDVEETGSYMVRLQPELFHAGTYDLTISVGPSIGFPVGSDKGKIGSLWGDSRDGGKRRHEGIDIFAPKGTPVVAAEDGVVISVKEGGIGGRVVWLKLLNKNVTLYYAHLDKQLVSAGQSVKKGDALGTVGNTGNAKHTPSHLHFGVYTFNGPIDPLPYVNKSIKTAPSVPNKSLATYLRLAKSKKLGDENELVPAKSLLVPLAVNSDGYISELPNGKLVLTSFATVEVTKQPIKQMASIATKGAVKSTNVN